MLSIFRMLFGAIVGLKIIQLIVLSALTAGGARRFGSDFANPAVDIVISSVVGVVMLVAVWFFATGRRVRLSSMVVTIGFVIFWLLGQYNNHNYLIASIFVIFLIDIKVSLLLKIQLSVLYFYAAITKINETYIAGNEIYVSMVQRYVWESLVGIDPPSQLLILISVASILVELFLAGGLWFKRTRWVALVVGVTFHVSLIVLVTGGVSQFVNLLVYGTVVLCLYLPFFAKEVDRFSKDRETAEFPAVA